MYPFLMSGIAEKHFMIEKVQNLGITEKSLD